MNPKSFVVDGVLALTAGDTETALATYYAPDFVQHSPLCADGRDGLRQLTENAKAAGASYTLLRSLAEDDMVLLHARVTGLAPVPLILFNLYRVADGQIAEHWETVAPETGPTASGHDMGDGGTEVTDLDRTSANKELVRRLVEDALVGGDAEGLETYVDGGLVRHTPGAADGVAGLRETLAATTYLKLHRVVAEGNFVFTQAEGTVDSKPFAFGDLFRVENGKVVEHWGVRTEVPAQLPHGNGMF